MSKNSAFGALVEDEHVRRNSALSRARGRLFIRATEATGALRDGMGLRTDVLETPEARTITTGVTMENASDLLTIATTELKTATATLRDTTNEILETIEELAPALSGYLTKVREMRMATVREMQDALGALRDVRKFFLERDYDTEMARLERFVALCRELQVLKASGTLDAVLDSALHLAVSGPQSTAP